jgi:hypothetical protein
MLLKAVTYLENSRRWKFHVLFLKRFELSEAIERLERLERSCAPAHWKDALAQLDRLGIPNGDRGEEAKGRTPGGSQGTYMDDPAGYVIQYITEGMQ